MKKIIILIELLVLVGVGSWAYLDRGPVKYNITLADGSKMSLTYEEFFYDYTMKNNLDLFFGAKFVFKDKVELIDDAEVQITPKETESGSFIRFESGMSIFISKKNYDKYLAKMELIKVGKKVKITTYFTEKSITGSFPFPALMPYMDIDNLDYDYSLITVE